MKRLLVASALAALILACVTPVVNSPIPVGAPRGDSMSLPAAYPPSSNMTAVDGMPMPPPYPPSGNMIAVDGMPMPPPYPPPYRPGGGMVV